MMLQKYEIATSNPIQTIYSLSLLQSYKIAISSPFSNTWLFPSTKSSTISVYNISTVLST